MDYAEIAAGVRQKAEDLGLSLLGFNLPALAAAIGSAHASYCNRLELRSGSTSRLDRQCRGFYTHIKRARVRLEKSPLLRRKIEQADPELLGCLLRQPEQAPDKAADGRKRSVRNPLAALVNDRRLQQALRDQFGIRPRARGGKTGKSPETPYVLLLEVIIAAFGTPYKLETIATALSHRNGTDTGQNVQRKHKMPSVARRFLSA